MSTTDKAYFVIAHYKQLLKRSVEVGHTQFTMHYSELQIILDQLDAERQRADESQAGFWGRTAARETIRANKAEAEIAALKGEIERLKAQSRNRLMGLCKAGIEREALKEDQSPVYQQFFYDAWHDCDEGDYNCSDEGSRRILFTSPQKPVVLPAEYAVDMSGLMMYSDEVVAAIEAAGGTVKEGE